MHTKLVNIMGYHTKYMYLNHGKRAMLYVMHFHKNKWKRLQLIPQCVHRLVGETRVRAIAQFSLFDKKAT